MSNAWRSDALKAAFIEMLVELKRGYPSISVINCSE